MQSDKVVMRDSDEAAQIKTVTGWVSRDGHFYGDDERLARYAGSTHQPCKTCGKLVTKSWLLCDECRALEHLKDWNALPAEPWDGESPLYSDALEEFFFHGEMFDHIDEGETEESLRLQHCLPRYLSQLDTGSWEDELSTEDESADLPVEVEEALHALNAAIKKAGPVTWEPKPVRVQLPLCLVCPGCSESGGAGMPVHHMPPLCKRDVEGK